MSAQQLHPAFYASRRQLWATLTSGKTSRLWWFFRRTGIGSNCTSLSKIWYVIFVIISGIWLLINAIYRYKDFKVQAYDPRFGNRWDESLLYLQLGAIITGLCLFPILLYTSLCRVGHSANDSVMLGRDTLHLQNLLLSLPALHKTLKSTNMDSMGNLAGESNQPNGRCRTRQDDLELDPFILKRRGEDLVEQISHNFKPFSSLVYVLFTYVFLLPVCVMEAEQIKNEAIAPHYVFQTNLDRIFGRSPALNYKSFFDQQSKTMDKGYPNDRPFPSHTYPLTPHELSTEYIFFLISLVVMTVQYGSPFYFTSRVFSLLFSAYTALTSVFLLIDVDTIGLVYKLSTAGARDQGGLKIFTLAMSPSTFSPWYLLAFSAAGLPAILIGLAGIYAYGEIQFKQAVINYAQLLIAGELPSRNSPSKSSDLGNVDNPNTCPDSVMTVEVAPGEHMGLDFGKHFAGLPLTLAVTTKLWRPTPTSSASRRMMGNSTTKLAGTPVAGSEISGTLRRQRGMAIGESTEMTNSIHTIPETTESAKAANHKWSRVGLCVLAGLSFIWLLITRICLVAQILRCYWETKLEIALADLAICMLYLICWLILWFGLAVKTAWRFRLLHTVDCFFPTSNCNGLGQRFALPNNFHPDMMGSPGTRNLQMTMNGAYPNLWPYISYPSWISNGTGMMAGLPIGETVDIDQMNTIPDHLANDPNGGSGRDSLYGCFTDIPPHPQTPADEVMDRYQTRNLAMPLRAGPPTLSDESDTTANHSNMGNSKYFRPVPTPSNNGSTYLNADAHQVNNYNYSNNPNSPYPGNYNETSHETSPFDAYEDYRMQNGGRNKGSKVAAVQALLQKQNMGHKTPDPTYATLATLSRPPNGPSPRSASTTPVVPDLRDQSLAPHLTRNTSYRKNCSRVTFKDNEMVNAGYRAVNNDGATGSSDSGVYTNGHGSGLNQAAPYVERQTNIKNRNKSDHPLGMYKSSDMNNSTSPSVLDNGFHSHKLNGIDDDNDDLEMSTDLTSLGVRENGKITERIAYFNRPSSAMAEDPEDRLCSQV